MKLMDLMEALKRHKDWLRFAQMDIPIMYIGCCDGKAEGLEKQGWYPSLTEKYILLVTTIEQAKAMAQANNGCTAIVAIKKIPLQSVNLPICTHTDSCDPKDILERLQSGEKLTVRLNKGLASGHFTYVNRLGRHKRDDKYIFKMRKH